VDYFTKAHEQASTYPLKYRLSPLETIKNMDTNMVVSEAVRLRIKICIIWIVVLIGL